ncbi:MAG: beta-mannanase [Deltaproteobacteria bacterium]|nr:beta-mannanase [Deltaproteobacteria bacterium]
MMKYRIYRVICFYSFFLFLAGYGVTSCSVLLWAASKPETSVQELVIPENGAYTGAYVDFGEREDDVTLEAIQKFEKMVRKHQAIIAFGNFWGEQQFSTKNVQIVTLYGAIPYIFWSPWDKPYAEDNIPDRFNLYNILSGMWDAYIDKWAEDARDFGKPLLVAWGLEMNGTSFPWSVYFYGGGQRDLTNQPSDYLGPKIFKQAYRYVVDRVRAKGARNIQWVFHVNNYAYQSGDWNRFAVYYPGSDYVDWLGMSVYGKLDNEMDWISFYDGCSLAYQEICQVDPSKPLMVAEWGVGEYPAAGNKAEWLRKAFEDYQERFPRIKAAIYWHERWQNEDESYSNLRVNSSPEALSAYREGVGDAYWIGNPRFHIKSSSKP